MWERDSFDSISKPFSSILPMRTMLQRTNVNQSINLMVENWKKCEWNSVEYFHNLCRDVNMSDGCVIQFALVSNKFPMIRCNFGFALACREFLRQITNNGNGNCFFFLFFQIDRTNTFQMEVYADRNWIQLRLYAILITILMKMEANSIQNWANYWFSKIIRHFFSPEIDKLISNDAWN